MAWRIKRIVRYILYILLLPVILAGIYLIIALILSFIKAPMSQSFQCPEKTLVYLSNNGVHLSIIVPVENLDDSIRSQLQIPTFTRYVSFGWGDRAFYSNTPTWADLTIQTAFKALFLKSASAMHVIYYQDIARHWEWVAVCPAQLERLIVFITDSFESGESPGFLPVQCPGYEENDCFYKAKGTFSCFKTCNVWVNKAFKFAAIPTSIWSPFVFGVEYHIR